MIEHIWIYPPLAFARLGGSDTPLECFYWGEDDNLPRGTGKTTILPGKTLVVGADGTLSSYVPNFIKFKDGDTYRPVCPFFELHARWRDGEQTLHEGPVTEDLLRAHNLTLEDLHWEISVANLKPFNMTQDADTRIEANVERQGDDFIPVELQGIAPVTATTPLVPFGNHIPLGAIQLIRPNVEFPGVRLRFTPAKGNFFGPTDLKTKWINLQLDDKFLFLNPNSSWCSWKPATDDNRGTPGGQYAQNVDAISYGMVDDVCDGLISCRIGALESSLVAFARIMVGPPDFAPDRRHLVSLADGLKDRVDREQVFDDRYFDDEELTDLEIRELMQRIYETGALNNVDVFNQRVNVQENPQTAIQQGIPFRRDEFNAFPAPSPLDRRPLPLSDSALEHHRRYQVLAAFIDMIRKQPDTLKRYVRSPLDPNLFFDYRMPAVMRGPSGDPLSLTRRQYQFLIRWAELKNGGNAPGASA